MRDMGLLPMFTDDALSGLKPDGHLKNIGFIMLVDVTLSGLTSMSHNTRPERAGYM